MATATATELADAKNCTVYVRNLEESVKIPKLEEDLEGIFGEYGNILQIVAKKSLRRKGQAFIVYDTHESAENAIEELDDFELFGKPMKLAFARTPSDAIVEIQGTPEELEAHKERRLAEKERKQALQAQEDAARREKSKRAAEEPLPDDSVKPSKSSRTGGLKSTATTAQVVPDEYLPPNKILFLQNVPADAWNLEVLNAIFARYPGFREVRVVATREGLAFVEYADETAATVAKEATSGMLVGTSQQPMKVTFQRQ